MAPELQDGQRSRRVKTLNSQMRVEGAIHNTGTESLPCIGSFSEETIIGSAFPDAGHRAEAILLVEDEAFVRRVTAEVLGSAGYILLIAETAAEALEACRMYSAPVDLLLTDVVMPGMNGRELAAEFKTLCPHAQVLLMSGYPQQLALRELHACPRKYLAKPFSAGVLLGRVREVLDMKLPKLEARP
jgi:CheY-like chemotaxis protein